MQIQTVDKYGSTEPTDAVNTYMYCVCVCVCILLPVLWTICFCDIVFICRKPACTCNNYTMGCPPVRGYNPRALASGLSYVQVDKHGITSLYHLHQCRPCTSRDIVC